MQKFLPWSLGNWKSRRRIIKHLGYLLLAFRQLIVAEAAKEFHLILCWVKIVLQSCLHLLQIVATIELFNLSVLLSWFLLEVFLSNTSTSCAFYDLLLSAENWPQKFFWMHFFALCYRRKRKMRWTHSVYKLSIMSHFYILPKIIRF